MVVGAACEHNREGGSRAKAGGSTSFFYSRIWDAEADAQVYFIQKIEKVAEIACLGPLYIIYTYARAYRDARGLIKYLKIILDTGELSSIIKMGEYYYYFFYNSRVRSGK